MKDYIEALREIKKENKDFKITLSRKEVLELVNEFDRLNNIINEFDSWLNDLTILKTDKFGEVRFYDMVKIQAILDKLNELRGDSSN